MRALVLYPYPLQQDGQSLQGHYLYKGLAENGGESMPCDRSDVKKKAIAYRNFNPDVVLGVGFWGDTPNLILNPLEHGQIPVPWFNADGWVANYQEILNKLPLILATSRWVKETYVRDGVKARNIHVAHIGYDPSIFYPRTNADEEVKELRDSFGIKDDEIMIFTAGGDVTSKGAQEIFKALHKVNETFNNWKYVCKVWPSKSARMHGKEEARLIKEFGFGDKVIYVKGKYSSDRMSLLLNACDIYAAPSRLEGFGMIQLEAQACGKPVISINVGGPRDTIVHGKTGFLADVEYEVKLNSEWAYESMGFEKKQRIDFPEPKTLAYRANIDQLADYLLRLLTDNALRERMGKAAAKHAYKKFNYNVTSKRIYDLAEKYVLNSEN